MDRIESEKKTVGMMVKLYCRRYEGNKELCQDCSQLLSYAEVRLDRCKFGNEKPTCKKCPIHCYKPDMRQKMRAVLRWGECKINCVKSGVICRSFDIFALINRNMAIKFDNTL